MGRTTIEWTAGDDGSLGASWQVTRGCSRVSPGCGGARGEGGCYAEGIAMRFSGPGQPFEGFALRGKGWTRKVSPLPQNLTEPLSWKKPRRVFVNSMSDLFHEDVPDEYIDRVFGVIAASPRHTFQILTKRAERMAAWFASRPMERPNFRVLPMPSGGQTGVVWPIRNAWIGCSVEDQRRADERIPHLLRCPAAVRFLSCEPLLGAVDLVAHLGCPICRGRGDARCAIANEYLHWVIAGAESGPGARPMDEAWVRSLRDQCASAEVSFFYKQNAVRGRKVPLPVLDGRQWREFPRDGETR